MNKCELIPHHDVDTHDTGRRREQIRQCIIVLRHTRRFYSEPRMTTSFVPFVDANEGALVEGDE